MLALFIVTLLALAIINMPRHSKPIKISKYSKQINHDTVLAILKTMQSIESNHDEDIQYLINMGTLNKSSIEKMADDYLFAAGEFPANELCLDPRDFAHLINVYSELVRGASDEQIKHIIHTYYR